MEAHGSVIDMGVKTFRCRQNRQKKSFIFSQMCPDSRILLKEKLNLLREKITQLPDSRG